MAGFRGMHESPARIALMHLQSLPRLHAKFTGSYPDARAFRMERLRLPMGMLVALSKL
jgi:hypothetical protein